MSHITPEEMLNALAKARMIARHLREACEKLDDPETFYSTDSEQSLYTEISLLNHMADTHVWFITSGGDREREPVLRDLASACERASRHFSRLFPKYGDKQNPVGGAESLLALRVADRICEVVLHEERRRPDTINLGSNLRAEIISSREAIQKAIAAATLLKT